MRCHDKVDVFGAIDGTLERRKGEEYHYFDFGEYHYYDYFDHRTGTTTSNPER